MRTLVLIAVIVLASANFEPYDRSVTSRDRSNIYIDCVFATSHMMQVYHNTYWNNFNAFVNAIIEFLKENALYVILSPYIEDDSDLSVYQAMWAWIGSAISNHCCSIDLLYYFIDTIVVTIWSRIDVDKFLDLLWANLNKYTTMEKYYWEEFWTACPFMYWEIFTNYVKPYLQN